MKLHQLPHIQPIEVKSEDAVVPCVSPSPSPSPIPSEDLDSMQDISLGMDSFGHAPLVRVC